jgi:hypothetical protein
MLDLAPETQGYKEQDTGLYPFIASGNACITQAVTAFVFIQRSLHRFPARTPYGFSIPDIKISSPIIDRHIIISEPGDPSEFGVLEKCISTRGIGYQTEKIFVSQIIDPGIGSPGILDYIFPAFIIKVSVFHLKVYF